MISHSHGSPLQSVVNLNWSYFPLLFAHNSNNRYAWGLDPKYLYFENPGKFDLLYHFRENKISGLKLLEEFNARFIVVDVGGLSNDHFAFKKLQNDPTVRMEYNDNFLAIFGENTTNANTALK